MDIVQIIINVGFLVAGYFIGRFWKVRHFRKQIEKIETRVLSNQYDFYRGYNELMMQAEDLKKKLSDLENKNKS